MPMEDDDIDVTLRELFVAAGPAVKLPLTRKALTDCRAIVRQVYESGYTDGDLDQDVPYEQPAALRAQEKIIRADAERMMTAHREDLDERRVTLTLAVNALRKHGHFELADEVTKIVNRLPKL